MTTYYNLLDALDDDLPFPAAMEADLFSDGYRDRDEESYNDMLSHGGDL